MDNYKKLTCTMKYLHGTKNLPLTLEAWWVDGSFAVHADMKSHTGRVISLGKGAVYGTST